MRHRQSARAHFELPLSRPARCASGVTNAQRATYARGSDAAVHPRAGGLRADDLRFGVQHLVPALFDDVARQDLLGELDEAQIVAVLGRPQAAVESLQLAVVRDDVAEQSKTLAAAGLDQR